MWWRLLLGLFVLIECCACNRKQDTSPSIPTGLVAVDEDFHEAAWRSALVILAPTAEESKKLVRLNPPLIVPSRPIGDDLPHELRPLYAVPTRIDEGFKLEQTPYFARLRQVADEVELGVVNITPERQAAVDSAKKVLFDSADVAKPSHVYERYLKYKKEHDELLRHIPLSIHQEETGADAQMVLRNKLKAIDEEWALFGNRVEVEKALALLAATDGRSRASLLESWRLVINANGRPSGKEIWSAIANPNGGTTVAVPLPAKPRRALTARTKKADQPWITVEVGGLKQINMTLARIRIKHPILEHPFVADRSWRFGKKAGGVVISAGDPMTTGQNEIVPWFVSEAIVVKSIDVVFEQSPGLQAFRELIEANDQVELAGAKFKASDIESAGAPSLAVSATGPRIFAVAVQRLPKSPDPDPMLIWPDEGRK